MDRENSISDHLVFFIHGMGQQYEKYGNMKHHVATMQKNTDDIITSHYPHSNIRIKYIPIEWHSVIHEIVDPKISKSTLSTVPKVRLATNHWLMDCLYYFTKPHGQHIINSICYECNLAYKQHVIDYPDFIENKGHIHFIGFSLGGISAYDIASMQWLEEDGLPPWDVVEEDERTCKTPDIQVPKLDFKITCVFTCGSPIAAGLVCRGLDYMHYRPPLRTKIFNIFHPFDPLGYRLEPMIDERYNTIQPVQIHRIHKKNLLPRIPNLGIKSSIAGAQPLLRSFWQYLTSPSPEKTQELQEKETFSKKRQREQHTTTFRVKRMRYSCETLIAQEMEALELEKSDTSSPPSSSEDENSDCSSLIGKDGRSYPRTDYVLSENIIDAYASEWIIALKSHFRYWANRDLTLHMVKTLLGKSSEVSNTV
ncbi:hypothetical protein K501DRAFT_332419 [Backusella circina FSU 941]|nr:hypothetical protein K501DRAFT_332419 [Backusella circina FSU 941]